MMNKIYTAIKWRLEYIVGLIWCEFVFCFRKIIYKNQYKKLLQFKDKHKGERCFIVGNGASLSFNDLELLKGERTFVVNAFIKEIDQLSYKPTYYGMIDTQNITLFWEHIIKHEDIVFFYTYRHGMSQAAEKRLVKRTNAYELPMMDIWQWGNYTTKFPKGFSCDISQKVYWGYTVLYTMIQVALYMGFKRIYLIGVDCIYRPKERSFAEYRKEDDIMQGSYGGEKVDKFVLAFQLAYKECKHRGTQLFNATRGGELTGVPRVVLEDVLGIK